MNVRNIRLESTCEKSLYLEKHNDITMHFLLCYPGIIVFWGSLKTKPSFQALLTCMISEIIKHYNCLACSDEKTQKEINSVWINLFTRTVI